MAEESIRRTFISIGCNRTPNAADSSRKSGRTAFGAHNTVALWDPAETTSKGIYATLKGHTDIVNVVRWVPGCEDGKEVIVSGSVDRSVRTWKEISGEFSQCQVISDHTGSVNCIAVLPEVLATGSSDGSVRIYSFDSSSTQYNLKQTLRISPLFPLTLSIHATNYGILLAIGGSSPHIHLYTSQHQDLDFTRVAVLKGHEDWIRGLSFTTSNTDIYLASASQDRYIRLWRISESTSFQSQDDTDALLTAALGGESYPFTLDRHNYTVTFSALLPGHDDWVFTVQFHPTNPDTLLSASADASLIIWRPEETSGIWIPETRLGEVSSLKGATTAQGSSGGFWGGVWACDGAEVSSWGKTGGWRVWREQDDGKWVQKNAIGGAIRAVKGISWDSQGKYLLSVSLDQTTRMFGEWRRDGVKTWHEIARPQIHGYDLNAVSSLPDWKFVSGADEKVLRVFQTSKSTANLITRLGGLKIDTTELPSTANLPVLGLSNKATTDSNDENPTILLDSLTTPPLEDHLSRYTLSPELEKLYAHPSEIIAVSTSHSGKFIASTCKSSTPDNSVIRIFDTTTYSECAILKGHGLTITKLCWAEDDSFLVSVGRDRQWTVYETQEWKVMGVTSKAHARIIWDVSVAPAEFGKVFVTGSRDKSVKIWGGQKWECISTVKFSEAVTSCSFLHELVGDMVFIAVGLENGKMYILGCEKGSEHFRVVKTFDERITHSEAVNGLAWRPGVGKEIWELASCGDDCSVRMYQVQLDTNATNGI